MASKNEVLTKNIRSMTYLRKNSSRGRSIANSKAWTKKVLARAGIPVPKLIALFKNPRQVSGFSWQEADTSFVVKPTSGSGGQGVWVVKKKGKFAGEWFLADGTKVGISDLHYHCLDILEGRYSLGGFPDRVLVEERVKIHPKFLRFTKTGTPDIRVVVYNKIPVMAMMRIPTEESRGKANLEQGAIGLGIDLATGITTYGVQGKQQIITKIFDLKRKKWIKVNGIKIPEWKRILQTSIECSFAIEGLSYFGADIFLDKDKGPMVVELNARPGLSIQISNRAGLRIRLEKAEGLKVRNVDHAVKIAQTLFGESFVDKVKAEEGIKVVEVLETVKIKGKKGKRHELLAKIDTGALRSSIDEDFAKGLGLLDPDNILFYRHYRSALARKHERPVIALTFYLKGRKIKTAANVTKRSHLNTPMLIGRRDLGGFLVKPEPVTTGPAV
ncbi:MAG: sugar-transfer associated ATP-grasp domain-containing protein [Candidatus Shapirobacteria bacterium]